MLRKNIALDGPTIQVQAIKYASLLDDIEFKASSGWLEGIHFLFNKFFKKLFGTDKNISHSLTWDFFNTNSISTNKI